MYTSKIICENIVDCVPEVVKWNSWDIEHLKVVHKSYSNPLYLLVSPGQMLFIDSFKIPVLNLKIKSMVFSMQWSNDTQVSFSLTPFFIAKNSIKLIEMNEKKTKVQVTYEFSGNYVQKLFFPIFIYLIKKWNHTVWLEDLILKIRRQKALEYGFIDFNGLPEKLEDRYDLSTQYFLSDIPVKVNTEIDEFKHDFFMKK